MVARYQEQKIEGSPSQESLALMLANCALRDCADWPLVSWKLELDEVEVALAALDVTAAAFATALEVAMVDEAPEEADAEEDPLPVKPPVAPVAAILAVASSSVSHVRLVPALFTSGRAKH